MKENTSFCQKLDKTSIVNQIIIEKFHNPIKRELFHIKKNEKYNYVKHRLKCLQAPFLDILETKDFMPINHISVTPFHIFGIITKMGDQQLTEENVYISSNIDESNNLPMKLNFSNMSKISIYPGQIVALYGKNVFNEFFVEKFNSIPTIFYNDITRNDILKYNDFYAINKGLQIAVINGPFMQDINILERALENDYDVLILLGPFLSSPNENIDCLGYNKKIAVLLESWLKKSMVSKIIIIPSTNELNVIGLYPQSENMFVNNERIVFMPNPCLFYINEFLFSVCNFDNLMHLASTEFSKTRTSGRDDDCSKMLFSSDRTFRLCNHLIYQQSFLSVFPNSECVDYSCASNLSFDIAPDFYITASRLKEFNMKIGPCQVINLGCQTKIENKYLYEICINKAEEVADENKADGRYILSKKKLEQQTK